MSILIKRLSQLWLLSCGSALLVVGCTKAVDQSGAKRPFEGQTLNVFNWSDYVEPEIISEFESRTGARVQYDTYSSDSELETKLLAGNSGYDVIFPSDRSFPML